MGRLKPSAKMMESEEQAFIWQTMRTEALTANSLFFSSVLLFDCLLLPFSSFFQAVVYVPPYSFFLFETPGSVSHRGKCAYIYAWAWPLPIIQSKGAHAYRCKLTLKHGNGCRPFGFHPCSQVWDNIPHGSGVQQMSKPCHLLPLLCCSATSPNVLVHDLVQEWRIFSFLFRGFLLFSLSRVPLGAQ